MSPFLGLETYIDVSSNQKNVVVSLGSEIRNNIKEFGEYFSLHRKYSSP